MGEAEKRSRLLKQLLAYSAGESIDVSDDSLKTMLQESLLFFFSREFSTTYEQAKSSGKLSLIQNQNLLRALSDNEENIKGLIIANDKLPVFDESFSDFNIKIEILSVFDRLGNFEWAPENHPQLTLSGENLHEYLRSPETYTRLHNIYYVNNIMNLWWKSINYSTGVVLEEIDISLNQL